MPDSNEKEPSIQLRVRPLSKFARRLLKEWKNLGLKTEGPVLVGVSGGADSVALLLGLEELWRHDKLGVDLNVGHFDHGLRIESRGDAAWVKGLAGRLNLSHHSDRASAGDIAQSSQENMEQWARHARYDFLERTASRLGAELILTGHTADDQAETVLMKLARGAASAGLAGMAPVRPIRATSHRLLARPLLTWVRRENTFEYCREREQAYLKDPMNENEGFARVLVRRRVIPLLETLNPRAVENIVRASLGLREDDQALSKLAYEVVKEAQTEATEVSETPGDLGRTTLLVDVLGAASSSVRRRALRIWIESQRGHLRRLTRQHILSIDRLVFPGRGGRIAELPGGGFVTREGRMLVYRSGGH